MARAVVKDIDRGWGEIVLQTEMFRRASILIGFQEGDTTKPQVKGTREKKGGLSMAQIAAANEFGTKKIPARPFMGTSFDENRQRIIRGINVQYGMVLDGKKNAEQALGAIGEGVVSIIKTKIRAIVTPPNSPRTIAAKGSSKPLIDFGQMINSVRYKVNV